MVVRKAQIIRCATFAVDPASVGIQSLRARSTGEQRKRTDDIARRARPAQAHIEIILRPSPSATLSAATSSPARRAIPLRRHRAKIVDKPQAYGVRIAIPGGNEMKVFGRSRPIGRRN